MFRNHRGKFGLTNYEIIQDLNFEDIDEESMFDIENEDMSFIENEMSEQGKISRVVKMFLKGRK